MKRTLALAAIMLLICSAAFAQRHTDRLDRGLVAVPTGSTVGGSYSNMVTWRRLADEYSGVTYNLYKDGSKVASNLTTTCFNDGSSAPTSTSYRVAAVINGVEQTPCDAVTPWTQYVYNLVERCPTGYLDINLADVYDRDGKDVTAHYEPNDAEMADLDGDGQLEIIIKRLNTYDASTEGGTKDMYAYDSKEFVVLDAYDVNWQTGAATLMWRIDCGPNMVSLNSTEIDIIAYDWDEDGKAEVVLRGADDMLILDNDGKTTLHTVGTAGINKRDQLGSHTNSQYAWTHRGNEYLIYMNGETGMLYQQMAYPLKRFESNETVSSDGETAAWGDNYGHRSSKYFMGAPVLDGRKASLFLARGIYTRHKMMALDLVGNEWHQRWSWNNNTSDSPWYGNGYHNFVIADVDEDGRDEIVYGSMVIDDNGRGLSTTGFGHGDAQHVGDFDPYRKGLEFFGCNEDKPAMNYRNATTSELYVRVTGASDDGRALMGNFSNSYPGSQGRSVSSGLYSSVADKVVSELGTFIEWGDLNFRIYWDGDLCDEILNSPGIASEAKVEKPGTGRLFTSSGCNMNNDSKNNPCFQGDIIGDWREEIVVRRGAGLRVYTSGMYTAYSMPCLWYDHEYRQAMVWQMMAYNQPPHVSYFVGEMEGFTQAPPPLTNSGRTEINNGGTISTTTEHLMMAKTGNMTVSVANGAAPRQLTVNTPSWVQGNDDNNGITTTYYTHTLTGGAFSGSMSLTKQGDGLLVMPNVTETYTGKTDVWAGSLAFSGTLSNSPVWMNRHTKFIGAPTISNALTMEYGAVFSPSEAGVTDATAASYATATVATLNMNEGARMVIQMDPANGRSDKVIIGTLNLRTRSGDAWTNYGPEYLKPVIQIVANSDLGTAKKYTLGTVDALNVNGTPVSGSKETPVASVALEGAGEGELYFYGGKLVLFFDGASWEEEIITPVYSNDFETTGWTPTGKTDGWTCNPGNTTANTFASKVIGVGSGTGDMGLVSPTMNVDPEKISIIDVDLKFKMDACTSGKSSGIEFITSDVNVNNGYVSSGTPFFSINASASGNGYWGSIYAGGTNYLTQLNQASVTYENNTLNRNSTGIVVLNARFNFATKKTTFTLKNLNGTTLVATTTVDFANNDATTLDRIFVHAGKTYGGVTVDDVHVYTVETSIPYADYTVRYVSTIADIETEIKSEEVRSGVVDETVTLNDADKNTITYGGHQYYYVSDNAGTSTIKEDNSTEVKIVFEEAAFSGDYYLKNKATGAYLAAGNYWGTQAITNTQGGHRVGLEALPQGKYRLNTYIYRDQNHSSSLHYLNDNYCDGEAQEWQIVDAGDGYYTLSNANGNLTGGAVDEALSMTNGTGDNTKWQILTAEERKAETEIRMASATPTNGVDATFYITAPGFAWADMDDRAAWQGSPAFGGFDNGGSGRSWNAEKFTNPYATFDVYQALTGVKPGAYKLTVQGYYRNGINNASDANDNLAKLYANSTEVPLKNIRYYGYTDDTHSAEGFTTDKSGYFVPDSQSDAAKTFNAGYYGNELYVVVGEDGNLRVGVKKTAATGANEDWACFDNFLLTYYGNDVTATIGSTGWTTFASPYPLDLSNMTVSTGDVKAYYASSVGTGKIVMTSTDSKGVAAGTGLMLKGTAGATVTIPVAISGTGIVGNMLVGCTAETHVDASETCYVLVNNGGTAEFQSLSAHGATIPAGKAYLNTVVNSARLIISFDEEDPTAISFAEQWGGAERTQLKDGKYLIDGKIVLVKNGVKYSANGQILK